jgi:hypothetical protein
MKTPLDPTSMQLEMYQLLLSYIVVALSGWEQWVNMGNQFRTMPNIREIHPVTSPREAKRAQAQRLAFTHDEGVSVEGDNMRDPSCHIRQKVDAFLDPVAATTSPGFCAENVHVLVNRLTPLGVDLDTIPEHMLLHLRPRLVNVLERVDRLGGNVNVYEDAGVKSEFAELREYISSRLRPLVA